MTHEEIMLKCELLYRQEAEKVNMVKGEDYEWKIGHAVLDKIAASIGFRKGKIPCDKVIRFMGIPVQIDYLRSECLELWKKVG